jgi:FG-GAP-like repeat/Abnormal spindle-like microcephaly-assoc'd, ASPM-SPD-2-Hydin/FG-GAP repeat
VNTRPQQTATNRGAQSISRRFTLTLAAVIALSLGASLALAQVPIVNNPLVPEQKAPGAATFTLTVNGEGFASNAVVKWNGTALTTTFVKSSKLTASVPAADLVTAGTATVTVENGTGVSSNAAHFQVVKNGYTASYGKTDYATDITPQDVVTADFNGDGNLDLAVATANNTISILLGNGTGAFPTHVQYAVPGNPVSIITGDFNGDGNLDLAVVTANNTISILLGNGTGAFPTHVQYAVPGNPVSIITGDFNGDGKVDLATVDQYQSQVSILLGNGDGTFQAHKEFATGTKPVALATGDFNGDGKLDLVVVDSNAGEVSVLLGNGDGTFQAHKEYPTGGGPSSVAVGDFNGDGKLDLAVVNSNDTTVSILFGNGDGTFQAGVAYPTATAPNSVVTGDFNGDGVLDLAVGTSNKSVSVLLGNTNGTFQNHKEYGIGANAVVVAAADMSANGKLSLLSANYNDNSVSLLGGNGDGTFKSASTFPVSNGPTGLAVGDFNKNGKLDIVVAASSGSTVSVLLDTPITVSPGLLSFGTQTSGDKSAAKTVTVKNTGTTAWTMGTISYAGSSSTDFSTSADTCGSTLAAGASCTISVVFDPTGCENADAQILITPASGGQLGNVLTGTGNTPITLTPRTQTFPTTLLGIKSSGLTNTFTNNSGINLYFSNIDLEGANQTDYSFTSTCSFGANPSPLAPGSSCTSTTYFSPTVNPAVNETTTFVYYANICLVKQGLLINGDGTAVKVSPTSITFPATKVGSTATKVVTFQNAGNTAMTISGAYFNPATANVFSVQSNTCGFVQGSGGSVPANSSCTFTLAFTPTVTGLETATFNIGDPDITGPQKVTLSGTGD